MKKKMSVKAFIIIVLLCGIALLIFNKPAWSLQPPMSQEELYEASDLVVEGKVLSVTLLDYKEKPLFGIDFPFFKYSAVFLIQNSFKERVQPGSKIKIIWEYTDYHGMEDGPKYYVPFYPGETARVYLKGNAYKKVGWPFHYNCKHRLKAGGSSRLPTKLGQVIHADEDTEEFYGINPNQPIPPGEWIYRTHFITKSIDGPKKVNFTIFYKGVENQNLVVESQFIDTKIFELPLRSGNRAFLNKADTKSTLMLSVVEESNIAIGEVKYTKDIPIRFYPDL